ncbi:hypothetical protein LWI28_017672 [Acer negundo]|uniref:Uncharacterized protein n=1 Tax=Acer negundo TaxID=4023 RepID=A0AAD5JAP3_ACENE|nr:hypothetical protein LWI28_017672 [Acer negundo]
MGLAIVGRASPALPILHLWWQHLPNTPPNIRSYPFNLGLKGLQRNSLLFVARAAAPSTDCSDCALVQLFSSCRASITTRSLL